MVSPRASRQGIGKQRSETLEFRELVGLGAYGRSLGGSQPEGTRVGRAVGDQRQGREAEGLDFALDRARGLFSIPRKKLPPYQHVILA